MCRNYSSIRPVKQILPNQSNADYFREIFEYGSWCKPLLYIVKRGAAGAVKIGTVVSSDFVWELTDMFNNLMVIPNVIALFALTGLVINTMKTVKDD